MIIPPPSQSIASPCVRNCCLDEHNICMGCGRSLEEIVRWGNATEAEKKDILAKSRDRTQQRRLRNPHL